jgi:hypothetical protein
MAENTLKAFSTKKDKMAVNYRNVEKCQMCDHFQGTTGCSVVEGSISPEATCSMWAMRSNTPTSYRDGQFYLDEYKKTTGSK